MDMLLGFLLVLSYHVKNMKIGHRDWVLQINQILSGKVLSNSDRISKFEKFLDSANYSGDEEDGGVFDARRSSLFLVCWVED